MKKFLSLVLALAMTLSLVTISAGAKDFTDDSDIAYKEAVDVISALNIVDGYSDDSFRPDGVLTRGAAAKIICNLILGPTTASALSASTAPFKDVPVTNTFAGYITYCSQQGIINGYADGTFRPTDTLSGNAFMKMLLGALGYDSSIEGYTGANWTVNVIKQAMGIGLDDGNDEFVGSKAVTRQEAALYAFNMLQSTLVEYDAKTTVNVNGATVTIAGDKAQDKAWGTGINNDGNIDKDGFVQFAEQYFGDLKLYDDTDDFGRPSNMWRLDGVKLGTYPREADVTYTAKVKSGDIYRDLGLNHTVNASKVTVYENGEADSDWSLSIKRSSDDAVHNTANGVLTEVFYDSDADEIVITTVDTYVGTINRSVAAKGDDPAFVEISVGGERPAGVSGVLEFETDEEFEDDAYVLYTYSQAVDEVKSVALAEEVTGTVTKSENNDTNLVDGKAVTIDDADRYVASKNLDEIDGEKLGDINVDEEYTIYLDAYGYLIFVEEVENNNYALVTAAASKSDFIGKKAELVFADGSTEIVNTDKYYGGNELGAGLSIGDKYDSGDAVIVTYRVDEDGVYKLKAVDTTKRYGNAEGFEMTNDKAGIVIEKNADGSTKTYVTANSASTFVVGETGEDPADIDEYTAYTGIKNAPTIKTSAKATPDNGKQADVYYYCKGNGKMVTIMFILPEANLEVEDGVSKMLFLAKDSVGNLEHDRNGDYFVYNAVVDDEITTVKVAEDVKVDGQDVDGVTRDGSGKFTGCTTHATVADPSGCDSYSEHVKNTLNGLYKSYSVDKYGIITNLKTFKGNPTNAVTFDGEEGYLTDAGIDKYNKEYTVIVGASKTTITCDGDATFYYVDEDGEITSRTYNAIAKDSDDKVYLYAKDYMVQTLFVEQVEPAKVPYGVTVPTGNFAHATVYVDGDEVAPGKSAEYERNDEDVVITVVPDPGYYFATAPKVDTANMTKEDNGSYTYTISRIRGEYNVTGEATEIPDETMNIQVSYVLSDGTEIKSVAPDKYEEDGTTGFAKVDGTVNLPENYQIVGKKVEYVPFVANTSDNVTFTVARATAGLTLPAGVTAAWEADASKGITDGSASAGTTQVPVGAAVTLTGINGTCGKNGEALPDVTFDMPAAGKAIDADSFGYVAVTVKPEVTIASATAGKVDITAEMAPIYVPVNSNSGAATITLNVTSSTDSDETLQQAKSVTLSTGSTSDDLPSGTYGATATEVTLNVTGITVTTTDVEITVYVA